jgi:hypothetical protein
VVISDYDECVNRSGCYWDDISDGCEEKPDCGDLRDAETCALAKDLYGMFVAFYSFVSVVVMVIISIVINNMLL